MLLVSIESSIPEGIASEGESSGAPGGAVSLSSDLPPEGMTLSATPLSESAEVVGTLAVGDDAITDAAVLESEGSCEEYQSAKFKAPRLAAQGSAHNLVEKMTMLAEVRA